MERIAWNQLLMLKVIDYYQTIMKLDLVQKIFLVQVEGRHEKRKTFNYDFYIVSKQPMSTEVNNDLKELEKEGYIQYNRKYMLTAKGKNRLEYYNDKIKKEKVDSFIVFMDYKISNQNMDEIIKNVIKKREIKERSQNPYTMLIPEKYNRESGKKAQTTIRNIYDFLDKIEKKCLEKKEYNQ